MNILVTGGAGFIGSHLAEAVLARGDTVRVLDNFSTGRRENIDALIQKYGSAQLEILEGDIRDVSQIGEAVRGVEVVFHSAAFVSVPQSIDEPQTCFDINVGGTHMLLESARRAGVRRVVLASSAAVYGESDALPLVEDGPLQPKSPYALSKRVNEMYAELFTNDFDLEVTALRYFNVYGPRQRPDSMYAAAVPLFIQCVLSGKPITIFGDGGQTRDLVNIHDVVRANMIASEHAKAAGQVFNICTGIETRLLDLLDVLNGIFPHAPKPEFASPRAGDIYRSVGSPQKARTLLGFEARTSLRAGLQETVESMRANSLISNL